MDILKLDVQTREVSDKAKTLLSVGLIPLEYYGRGVENRSFKVDYQDFRRLFIKAGGNTVVELTVDGKDKLTVLIHRVDRDPVSDKIAHADLINVRMDEEITTNLPLELVGVAPAVKELGGTLTHHLSELEVRCLPKDLIHSVEVDVSSLVDFHTAIRVSDVSIPSTVTVLNDPEDIIATVSAPREEEPEVSEEASATEEKADAAPAESDSGQEG